MLDDFNLVVRYEIRVNLIFSTRNQHISVDPQVPSLGFVLFFHREISKH